MTDTHIKYYIGTDKMCIRDRVKVFQCYDIFFHALWGSVYARILHYIEYVSYTHLDVYKRQLLIQYTSSSSLYTFQFSNNPVPPWMTDIPPTRIFKTKSPNWYPTCSFLQFLYYFNSFFIVSFDLWVCFEILSFLSYW